MTQNNRKSTENAAREEYPEAIEAIKTEFDSETLSGDEASSDAFLQFLQYAGKVCVAYDVPDADRVAVICEGIRQDAYDAVDGEIETLRWQLHTMQEVWL